MKRVTTIVCAIVFLAFGAKNADAIPFTFDDVIIGPAHVVQDVPLFFTHDINDDVNFAAGETVTDASLELYLTGGGGDSLIIAIEFNGGTWSAMNDVGPVDTATLNFAVDSAWLNDDGYLTVGVSIWNHLPSTAADIWIHTSTLSVTASAAPVPEPATILLLGSGLAATGIATRKKRRII